MSRSSAAAQSRKDTAFARGDLGVDGAATEEKADPSVVEQAKAQEALLSGRTWLGRECLTWLLWKSESTEPICEFDDVPVTVVFSGKLGLKAGGGEVTDAQLTGSGAPYSKLVKQALAQKLLVHGARLQINWGEQLFEAGLDASFFDVRSAKLPTLMQEEEGERLAERLEMATRASQLVDALISAFVEARTDRTWAAKTVPAIVEWLAEA